MSFDLKNAIRELHNQFSGYEQQGSHEFLMFLLSRLCEAPGEGIALRDTSTVVGCFR